MTALNNVTTQDRYTDALTIRGAGFARLTLHVANASIDYQLGHGVGGILWDDEVFLPAGETFSGERGFDAVRVRSHVPGKPAQVTVDAG